ncbi:hypothetical protein ACTS9U_10585 [Empedobacter falsenii]|uniref:hypothetical protein n=1 Tax=Empedobacter TaxID=59734 RepID=UPI00056FBAC4|nr:MULTISPECIES: hypothetical protein [Empedobacter]MDH1883930.1 hypothetical protein [Empedobacter sp. GD03797]MDM1041583.1 hypothetical protein [Empedobacter brevis]MDM1135283.1 hypothetical protein [Empedobacter sp. R750]
MEENNFWIYSTYFNEFIKLLKQEFNFQKDLDLIKYNLFQTNFDKDIWFELSESESYHKIEISKDNDDRDIIFFKIITTKNKMDSIQSFLSEIEKE